MRALILAGGKGTRLRPLTVYTPKPIVPLANRPFLLYQLAVLRNAGITDITLSLSYQPDKIEQVLGDGSEFGVNLSYVTEPSPLGTGGAYSFAALSDAPSIVLNGDILTDIDLAKVVRFHERKKADATLVLAPVEDPTAYGLVETGAAGEIRAFIEKPTPADLAKLDINTINAGIYVLEPKILDLVPKGENRSFEYDVFPRILEKAMSFFAYTLENEYWRDIGTCSSYLAAHHDFLAGKIKGFEDEVPHAAEIATAAFVDRRSVIGPDCIVKPGAKIVNSVVGAGVTIEEKAVVENSVIWPHSRISTGAEVHDSIIGRGCHIGRSAVVDGGSVLGDKTSISDYSRV
ncbi:MAG: NDP-sugar synthase [Acidobacteriota bacterium]